MGLFLVVHVLLSIRHAQGFHASLEPGQRRRTLHLLVITALVALTMTGVVLWNVRESCSAPARRPSTSSTCWALTVSLWMGWGSLIRSFYPRLNAWFIAIGIANFYFCDISVGLAADLTGTTAGAILNNLVGLLR